MFGKNGISCHKYTQVPLVTIHRGIPNYIRTFLQEYYHPSKPPLVSFLVSPTQSLTVLRSSLQFFMPFQGSPLPILVSKTKALFKASLMDVLNSTKMY